MQKLSGCGPSGCRHGRPIGAKPGDGGWTVTLSSAKFKAGKVSFAPDDEATVGKIAKFLKANLQPPILIEDFADEHGSRTHAQRLSQEHADAVLGPDLGWGQSGQGSSPGTNRRLEKSKGGIHLF